MGDHLALTAAQSHAAYARLVATARQVLLNARTVRRGPLQVNQVALSVYPALQVQLQLKQLLQHVPLAQQDLSLVPDL